MLFDEVKLIYGFPDGRTVVSYAKNRKEAIVGGANGSGIKVYNTDADDQEYISTALTEHHDSVTRIATSNSGSFATGGEDGIVALYKPDNTFEKILFRSAVAVRDISFQPDGSRLAIATDENTIRIILTADNSKIIQLEDHTCPVKSVDYHPTGKYLLSSDINGNIKVWDEQKCIKTYPGFTYKSEIDSLFQATVAWNPDGSSFAFPGTNKNVRIFRSETLPPWSLDNQHTSNVITLAWSPNGHYLASSSEDNSFVIWDVKTRKTIVTEITSAQITGIAWSFTENEIAITDVYGQVRIWKDVIPIDTYSHPAIKSNTDSTQQLLFNESRPNNVKIDKETPIFDNDDLGMFEELGEEINGLDMNDDEHDQPQVRKASSPPRQQQQKQDTTAAFMKKQLQAVISLDPPTSFQPGETPYHQPGPGIAFAPASGERRYMAFNAVGVIYTTFEDDHSTINVEFHGEQSEYANYNFTDFSNFTVGALSTAGAAFAVEGKETTERKPRAMDEASDDEEEEDVVTRTRSRLNFRSNERDGDWTYEMLPDEDVVCVAVNRISVIVTTSLGYVRIFSTSGVQKHLFSLENVVSVTAITDLAFIVYSKGPAFDAQQNLQYLLINTDTCDMLQKDRLQLSTDSELTWIGFSETNQAATYDSAGILRVLERQRRPFQASWVPVFDGKAYSKSIQKSERYWPVGLLRDRLLCIVLRGSNTYPYFPLPSVTDVPLQLPLLDPTTEVGKLEEQVLRINTINHHERDEAEATNTEEASAQIFSEADIEMDVALLKLINLACKSEKLSRATDLTYTLHTEESIDKAIQIASFHRFTGLAEKMMSIKEEKFTHRTLPLPSTLTEALQALPAIYASSETALDSDLSFVTKHESLFGNQHRANRPSKRMLREEKIVDKDEEDDSIFLDTQANKRAKPFRFSS